MEILTSIGIILTYVLIIAAAGTALVFGIIQYIPKIKDSWIIILSIIGGFTLIILIAYFLASDEILIKGTTASTAKRVGMGLITLSILGIGAIGVLVYAELSKLFK